MNFAKMFSARLMYFDLYIIHFPVSKFNGKFICKSKRVELVNLNQWFKNLFYEKYTYLNCKIT